VAVDGTGGVYGVAFDGRTLTHLRRFSAAGDDAPGWTASSSALNDDPRFTRSPRLAPDGAGGVFGAFLFNGCANTCFPYDGGLVVLQHVTSSGARSPGWPATGLAADSTLGDSSDPPILAADGASGVLLMWNLSDLFYSDPARFGLGRLYGQRFDAAGQRPWGAGVVQLAPGFDTLPGSLTELHAQRIGADGSLRWATGIVVASGIALGEHLNVIVTDRPAMCSDGAGGIYLAWSDTRSGVARPYVTRLDGAGHLVAPWPSGGLAASSMGAHGFPPLLAPDASGGVFVAWRAGPVTVTHLLADGSRVVTWPAEGRPLCIDGPELCSDVDTAPWYLLADGAGGAFAAWHEDRVMHPPDAISDHDRSYIQHVVDEAPVAALASLVSASADERSVRVEWWTSEPGSLGIERAIGGADAGWSELTSITPERNGHVTLEDAEVERGQPYGYRLRVGSNVPLGEAWVTVPLAAELRIDGPRPSPARGHLTLALLLADASPATLELFDAAGRRVLAQRAAGLGAGAHVLPLDGSGAMPAGIYLARLTQGRRAVAKRICVVR
jgi:hypothetical protein